MNDNNYEILLENDIPIRIGSKSSFYLYISSFNTDNNRPWTDISGHHEGRVKVRFGRNEKWIPIIYTDSGKPCEPHPITNITNRKINDICNFIDNNVETIMYCAYMLAIDINFKLKSNINMFNLTAKSLHKRKTKRPNSVDEYIYDKFKVHKNYYDPKTKKRKIKESLLDEILNMF